MVPDARTFADLLARRLRTDPGRPLLTSYDEQSGERTELSAVTFANWVSKTANLLTDELGLDDGDTVLLDLPPHWLVPVFLGAAWSSGLRVTTDPAVAHDLVVCGPGSWPAHASTGEVLACSLRPFAVRFPEPLPAGVLDYGLAWPGQSDVFGAVVPPGPGTPAWVAPERSQADLLDAAAATAHPSGVRLLTLDPELARRAIKEFLTTPIDWYMHLALHSSLHLRVSLRTIDVPTSFLAGKFDILASSHDMSTAAKRIPGATYEEIVATHFISMEKPTEVHDALLDLLDRVRE